MTASIPESTGIFVSYRREDASYPAGWLFDRLVGHFGEDQVFKDVDSIRPGDDFLEEVTAAVGSCVVLLAVIGQRWLTVTGEDGRPRLNDPADLVRLEIETALARGVRVIPVLLDGARMPRAADLPASLEKLTRRQALVLSPGSFNSDTGRLLKELDVTVAAAYVSLGNALINQGRFTEAEAACREAMRLDPGNADAHAALGATLNNASQPPEAESALREAIRLNPTLAWAHATLATVLNNLDRSPEAEAAAREAIRLDPTLAWAHAALGTALDKQDRSPEAEAAAREAIRLDPTYAWAHATLGAALNNLGRSRDAEDSYREAIRLNPADAWAHSRLGFTLNNLGRHEEAQDCYREATRLDPASVS